MNYRCFVQFYWFAPNTLSRIVVQWSKLLEGYTSDISYILKKKKETSLEWLWQTNVASFSWYRPQSEANRKSSYYDGWKSIWGSVFSWREEWLELYHLVFSIWCMQLPVHTPAHAGLIRTVGIWTMSENLSDQIENTLDILSDGKNSRQN